jgi:hypothetical protein
MTSEARLIWDIAIYGLFLGSVIGICGFAWWKGRPAEKYGALLYVLSLAATMVLEFGAGSLKPIVPELFFDGLAAIGFLYLAIRYNNLWLGAAMMLNGVQLALHATRLTETSEAGVSGSINIYALGLTLVSFAILLVILGGTLAGLHVRRKSVAA